MSSARSLYDGSDALVREFVFGEVIDEVLMLKQADVLDFDSDSNTAETTRSFYHRNVLGSVMEITDMNEAIVVSYRYAPYGGVTITRNSTTQSSDPLGNPWMYTGRFRDEESGLYYYRTRCFSPDSGRFLQRDPLGYAPGPNLYEYVSSSPPNGTDPFGLEDPDGKSRLKKLTPEQRKKMAEKERKRREKDAKERKEAERRLGEAVKVVKDHGPKWAKEALEKLGEDNVFVHEKENQPAGGWYEPMSFLETLFGGEPWISVRRDLLCGKVTLSAAVAKLIHELRHAHQDQTDQEPGADGHNHVTGVDMKKGESGKAGWAGADQRTTGETMNRKRAADKAKKAKAKKEAGKRRD